MSSLKEAQNNMSYLQKEPGIILDDSKTQRLTRRRKSILTSWKQTLL